MALSTCTTYIPAVQEADVRCPSCGEDDDKVVDSRPADNGVAIRRRRACNSCNTRYTTVERPLLSVLEIRKRNGRTRPFDIDKVRTGIDRSANGRLDRDVVLDAADAVERALRADGDRIINSEQVGLEVLAQLRLLDPVAYVRFASVYKNFEGPEDFEQELDELSKEAPPKGA
jgi:transcriptional repressor NrdR